jgi:hypothetical protein
MPVIEATTNEVPIGTRAVLFKFTLKNGKSCSVTFDRYSTDHALFSNLNQMTSNAVGSVIASGRDIETFKTYFVN